MPRPYRGRYGASLAGACILVAIGCARPTRAPVPRPAPPPKLRHFTATAYSLDGLTASGTRAREGIVAADPRVLPLGSRIRVLDAGRYSGEYLVEDTGKVIKGNKIDIYISDDREAKRFGRRRVRVEVLRSGRRAR